MFKNILFHIFVLFFVFSKLSFALDVVDITPVTHEGMPGIAVIFDEPIDSNYNYDRYINIDDKDGKSVKLKGILDKGLQIIYYAPLENNALYKVSVKEGLTGINSVYKKNVTLDVQTIPLSRFVKFINPGSIITPSSKTVLPITVSNMDNIFVNVYVNKASNKFFSVLFSKIFVKDDLNGYQLRPAKDCVVYKNFDKYNTLYLYSFLCDSDIVFSKSYNVDSINAQKTLNLEIPEGILKENGLYTVVIQTPYEYREFPQTTVIVSDIGLQVRDEADGVVVYARSLTTGKPMPKVNIKLSLPIDGYENYDIYSYNNDSNITFNTVSAVTDNNGVAVISKPIYLDGCRDSKSCKNYDTLWGSVLAEKDGMFAYLDRYASKVDLSDFDLAGKVYTPVKVFFYSPRDLYRGGEEVTYNILVRDDNGYSSYNGFLNITLRDPMGKAVDNINVKVGEYNTYSYKLDSTAKTGNWEISVEYVGTGKYFTTKYFTVSDFIPETLSLTIGDINEPSIVDFNVARNLKIQSSYLYGAPASGNQASASYRVFPTYSFSGPLSSYIFADPDLKSKYKYSTEYLEDETLNENGEASWSINESTILDPFKNYKYNGPITIRYYASVYESGGRGITRSKDYTFLPLGEVIGVKPSDKKNIYFEDIFFDSNNVSFDIININDRMDTVPAKVSIEIERVIYNYYWTFANDKWSHVVNSVVYPVSSLFKDLDNKPTAVSFDLVEGNYRMKIKNMNNDQHIVVDFTVGNDYYDYYDGSSDNTNNVVPKPDKLTFYFDKPSYKVGDTAKIEIISPYDGIGRAILESSKGILWSRDIITNKGRASISIPINKNISGSDLYVSAYIVRGEKELEELDKSMLLGVSYINIDRSDRKIPLEIIHPSKIEPDKDYNITIRALDKNLASGSYVTLSYVDSGILSLKKFTTPDPINFFFAKVLYNVSIYDNFWQVIHKNKYTGVRYGGDLYTEELNTASARGGDMARAHIKIASYFSKPIKFDSNGEVTVPIRVDDFNGKVHLVATAFSKSNYGVFESDMLVSEEIITTLSTPRFLATGDLASFALDIANTLDEPATVDLKIKVNHPLELMGNSNITVKIDPHKKDVVLIPVHAIGASGTSNITITINSGKYFKEKTWKLDVRSPYPAQTISNLVFVDKNEAKSVFSENIKKYVESSAVLSLAISNIPPIRFSDLFSSLLNYPYGCLEQTVSKTLPLLFLNKSILDSYNINLNLNGADTTSDIKSLTKPLIDHGIKGVLDKMLPNGSFGYWDSQSSESQWGTVYAAELLNYASKAGYNVDRALLEKVNLRLLHYVRNSISNTNTGYYDFNNVDSMAIKAYAAYVLSKYALLSTSDLVNVYDAFVSLPNTYMISHMHFALAFKNTKDRKRASKAIQIAEDKYKEFFEKKTYNYKFYGSDIRDIAWGLSMLLEYDNDLAKYNDYYIGLSNEVAGRTWLSTQEIARLLQLLNSLGNKHNFDATIIIEATKKEIKSVGRYETALRSKDLESTVAVKSSSVPLYVSSSFIAYPKEAPIAFNDNASIQRYYYSANNKLIEDLTTVKVGDYILVELRFSTAVSVSDGLVVDLIPSGFEIEDQYLDNSYKINNIKPDFEPRYVVHEEFRDDRYIASVYNYRGSTNSVWYVMRAVTPGIYSNPNPYFEDMYRFDVKSIGVAKPAKINIIDR